MIGAITGTGWIHPEQQACRPHPNPATLATTTSTRHPSPCCACSVWVLTCNMTQGCCSVSRLLITSEKIVRSSLDDARSSLWSVYYRYNMVQLQLGFNACWGFRPTKHIQQYSPAQKSNTCRHHESAASPSYFVSRQKDSMRTDGASGMTRSTFAFTWNLCPDTPARLTLHSSNPSSNTPGPLSLGPLPSTPPRCFRSRRHPQDSHGGAGKVPRTAAPA